MRAQLLLVFVATACDSGAHAPRAAFTAKGSLQYSRSDPAADEYLASEMEILRGQTFLASVAKRFPDAKLSPGAIVAARRPGTMILDVSVASSDAAKAAAVCNHVMQTFIELHLQKRLARVHDAQAGLTEDLEQNPGDEAKKKRLEDLLAHAMDNDVTTLERCAVASSGSQAPRGP